MTLMLDNICGLGMAPAVVVEYDTSYSYGEVCAACPDCAALILERLVPILTREQGDQLKRIIIEVSEEREREEIEREQQKISEGNYE